MINIYRSVFTVFLMLVGLTSPTFAHSFNVTLVLPASTPQAKQFHMGVVAWMVLDMLEKYFLEPLDIHDATQIERLGTP